MIPRILLFNDNHKAGGLTLALRQRGAHVTVAPMSAASFDSGAPAGMLFPGLGKRLPDAVFVRSMAAGTFEAITRRLGILHALERHGVPVWNPPQAIERCVDKSMTTYLLKAAGLPTPQTFAVEGLEAAQALLRRDGGPLVLKPLFGAQGNGIRRIDGPQDLPPPEAVAGVYYLQRMVARAGPPFEDFRVFVCGSQAIAMMRRVGDHWITNVQQGAQPVGLSVAAHPDLAALGIEAARAVGAAFAGVDVIADSAGKLSVIEVNSMPAWSGLQSVTETNIAGALADAFLASLHARGAAPPARRLVSPANG